MPSISNNGSTAIDQSDGETTLATVSVAGTYQLALDLNDLANGETAIARIKGKVRDEAGETARIFYQASFSNVQGIPNKLSIPVVIAHTQGHPFTLEIEGEVSDVNSALRWIAGGGGTGEFYVELVGGGDPSIASPNAVYEDGVAMTQGTVDSLAAGEWDYADSDTLGFNTIYVRLSDDADPDSKADDFVGHSYNVTVLWAVNKL